MESDFEEDNSIFKKCLSRKKPSNLDLLEVNYSATKNATDNEDNKELVTSMDEENKNDVKKESIPSKDHIDNKTIDEVKVIDTDITDNNDKDEAISVDGDHDDTKENSVNIKDVYVQDGELNDNKEQDNGHQQDIQKCVNRIKDLQLENVTLTNEIKWLQEEVAELKTKCDFEAKENKENVQKLKKLEIQYAMLKEKSNGLRTENDFLVEKIQKLHKDLGKAEVKNMRASVTVSVSEYEDIENDHIGEEGEDDLFYSNTKPEATVRKQLRKAQSLSTGKKKHCCAHEEILTNEEKRFEEAAETILRLEQRVSCLQKANNVNSCASCKPLRNHVVKVEKELQTIIVERATQLEELYELKQEALSSAIGEKDAHLSWLNVTTEGNVHTKEAIDKLKREKRELLNRLKQENENRQKLTSSSMNNSMIFTLPAKITSLGAFGRSFSGDEEQQERLTPSTSSFQSISTTPDMEGIIMLPTPEMMMLPSMDMMMFPSPVQDE